MSLGHKKVPLPVKITVRNKIDGRILRTACLVNFKQVELDVAGVKSSTRQFSGFTSGLQKYWQLREKYWNKSPEHVENEDVEVIKQLLDSTEKDLAVSDNSTGEKFKNLNIMIELNRIIGNATEMERHYQSYLSILCESKLTQMMLVGGYGVIETSMFRKRQSEAERLLGPWINTVLEINDGDLILHFARSQLAKKRLWTTVKLLEALLDKKTCPANVRFEAEAIRSITLDKLCKLLRSEDIDKKGLKAEVQANWVVPIGKHNLDEMLDKSKDQASQSFAELSEPTESQQALKAQLDKIDIEIRQENEL